MAYPSIVVLCASTILALQATAYAQEQAPTPAPTESVACDCNTTPIVGTFCQATCRGKDDRCEGAGCSTADAPDRLVEDSVLDPNVGSAPKVDQYDVPAQVE